MGPSGISPWQNEEMRAAIDRRVREGRFRVIPVLLPGAKREERSRLPSFMVATTWVEFRKSLNDDEAFHRLNKDETRILTWSYDGTARLWEAKDGSPIGQPMKHDGVVYGAEFNKDETRILTWSDDDTARLWNIEIDEDFPRET